MNIPRFLITGVLTCVSTVSLFSQSITSASATYNAGTGGIEWSFTFDEGSSSDTLSHLVLGFDSESTLPNVWWDDVNNVTVSSSTYTVSKVEVWPDETNGISYLELNFDSPIALTASNATYDFNYVTGGTQNLMNSADFFVSLYSGASASANTLLDGSLVATFKPVSLSAVPEPSTYAMWAGLVGLGLAGWFRRRAGRVDTTVRTAA